MGIEFFFPFSFPKCLIELRSVSFFARLALPFAEGSLCEPPGNSHTAGGTFGHPFRLLSRRATPDAGPDLESRLAQEANAYPGGLDRISTPNAQFRAKTRLGAGGASSLARNIRELGFCASPTHFRFDRSE